MNLASLAITSSSSASCRRERMRPRRHAIDELRTRAIARRCREAVDSRAQPLDVAKAPLDEHRKGRFATPIQRSPGKLRGPKFAANFTCAVACAALLFRSQTFGNLRSLGDDTMGFPAIALALPVDLVIAPLTRGPRHIRGPQGIAKTSCSSRRFIGELAARQSLLDRGRRRDSCPMALAASRAPCSCRPNRR